ncbi:MAG: GDSL-type esterase/lipase family protein [Candidatus Omnitrophica bacterium]|nr:GDSL-type esterase/lipase family protein [Candidatus Omnitrophota bacterium]
MKINRRVQGTRYKVQISLIAILGFCALAFCGCGKKGIVNVGSSGESIVCFGDSITFGYGVTKQESYPMALAEMVTIPVINEGIDGDTSTEALQRLETDVLSRNPQLVIVEFGGNDFLRKVPEEKTLQNIREMIDRIQAKGAMVALVDISAGMLMKNYRHSFHDIAREKGVIFISNLLSGIITNPRLKSDFLHPNHAGYMIVAMRIYRAISPYIDKKYKLVRK